MYKPHGYPDLSAYLVVADAQATLDFAARAFGAELLRCFRDEEGVIRHAELRIGDSVVMLGQMPGGPEAHLHLYVADPDAVQARALAAGVAEVAPQELKPDGDRRGGVRDANGTTWWIARQEAGG
ncbi:VOC family protein [Oceanicella sp. SM1341]|uniref:VOC family protein n=1 Tax=Oceanicella sp. SM1341 TaxID=1548889 RepID=UPI000E467D52|nr:VOC family protein [Oceanicella sp. SM1341]